MQPDQAKQRIQTLRDELREHNYRYYTQAQPVVSDRQYDQLMAELIQLEADFPQFASNTSPTQRVGGSPSDGFVTVEHSVPMMSIDNTYDQAEIERWAQRISRDLPDVESLTWICEPKIDGVAISLRYENGRLTRAVTRGDGQQGDEVTANVRTITGIPLILHTDHPPDIMEVRGEIYMSFETFARINQQLDEQGEKPFANPRNATAGTLKRLDPTIVAQRKLQFMAHGMGALTPADRFDCHSQFLKTIDQWRVPTNQPWQSVNSVEQIWQYISQFETQRHDMAYPVDGVVIRLDQYDLQQQLGTTSKAPRWCVAYKYAPDQARTELIRVDWQVGKTGKLTPRATMKPVQLAGTTVQHATLHNLDEIQRKDIRIHDRVIIEKAGEIIPQVVAVDLDDRPADTQPIQVPAQCPSCRGPIVQEPDEVAHRCVNPECPAQFREKLIHFAGRNQMDIDGLGEKLIDQLLEADMIRGFADLYQLDTDRLLTLERMGERKAEKLLQRIDQSRHRGLTRVLAALGIRHVGMSTARRITSRYHHIEQLLQADAEALSQLQDVGPIVAESLVTWLHSDAGKQTIESLRQANVRLEETPPPTGQVQLNADHPFAGKKIVLTGTLAHFKRPVLADLLTRHGATVSSSVSAKTDLVIAGEKAGSKLDKAHKHQVTVWNEDQLMQAIKDLGIA